MSSARKTSRRNVGQRDEHDAQQDDHTDGDHHFRALLEGLEHAHTTLLCRLNMVARIRATAR